MSRCSDSRPSSLADAPVAMISVAVRSVGFPSRAIVNGLVPKSTAVTWSWMQRAPKRGSLRLPLAKHLREGASRLLGRQAELRRPTVEDDEIVAEAVHLLKREPVHGGAIDGNGGGIAMRRIWPGGALTGGCGNPMLLLGTVRMHGRRKDG